jgi:hypothetical protein
MQLEIRELEEKLQLLDFVTAGLVSGRDSEHIKTLLKGALSKTFTYLPSVLSIIYARIDVFGQPSDDSDKEEDVENLDTPS